MKTASITRLPDRVIIYGLSKTTSGFRIATAPFFNLPNNGLNTNILANAIKKTLCNDDSKRVPDPKDWKQSVKEFTKNIGLKSVNEIDKPTNKHVLITDDGTNKIFTPSRPANKPDKGFLYKDKSEAVSISSDASDTEISEALNSAFDRCG